MSAFISRLLVQIKHVRQNCDSTKNFKVSFEESVLALFNSSTLCILWVASQSHRATQGFIKGKIFSVKGHRRCLRDPVWLMIRAPHPSIRTIWYKTRPILFCVKGLQGWGVVTRCLLSWSRSDLKGISTLLKANTWMWGKEGICKDWITFPPFSIPVVKCGLMNSTNELTPSYLPGSSLWDETEPLGPRPLKSLWLRAQLGFLLNYLTLNERYTNSTLEPLAECFLSCSTHS